MDDVAGAWRFGGSDGGIRSRVFADLGHAAEVDLADEVAKGIEGVVEFLDGIFGAFAGFGVVTVEAGFGDEVRSGAGEDLQGAIFEDGGNAGPDVVVGLADGEAGGAEFEDLAGALRVGVPGDAFGEMVQVVAEGLFAAVVFAGDPEDVVAIDDTPDGGEGIADAKVHAADFGTFRRGSGVERAAEIRVDEPFERFEGTAVFLAEPGFAQGSALAGQSFLGDTRDLVGRDLDAVPVGAAVGPGIVKEAALAVGSGQADHAAVGDGEHGADGAVEVIGDAGGFIDDQQVDIGVAADRVFFAGQTDNPTKGLKVKFAGCLALAGGRPETFVVLEQDLE